ncbi:ROK family protein [Malacoplasma iowae]|uniref:ROK family protein n=1 Tax=Malacoplasma iowae TaxID=2116 RepID=UPI002A187DD9|nr:ROK family protein [Malacoplasma iowae]WPL40251.1 ROK family protein [Malacoplasma iowae]
MNKIAIFDVGGTSIKYSLDELKTVEIYKTKKMNKNNVIDFISSICNEKNINIICLSVPGIVNSETGYITGLSAIDNWNEFNIFEEITEKLNNKEIKIYVENDGNCSLLGNLNRINNKKINSAISIVYGTGIGGSCYFNGKIYKGFNNSAGEFGMFIETYNDINNASLLNSTVSLCRQVYEKTNIKLDGDKILDLYDKNNCDFKEIVTLWFKRNATLIYNIIWFLNPEIIFIGGGISANDIFKKNLFDAIKKLFNKNKLINRTKIIFSYNGNMANLEGAYILYKKNE